MSTPQAAQAPNKMPPSNSSHLLAINKHKKDLHDIMQQLTAQGGAPEQSNIQHQTSGPSNGGKNYEKQQMNNDDYDYLKKLKK
jgi:hypothetical protein